MEVQGISLNALGKNKNCILMPLQIFHYNFFKEFVILNTCLIQSTTITSAAGKQTKMFQIDIQKSINESLKYIFFKIYQGMLIGCSSLNRKPLDFQLLQGSLIAGGVSAGAVAATKIQPWGAACLGIGTG